MIIKSVTIISLLLAASNLALSSSIKGREEATKGGARLLTPVEQQKLLEHTKGRLETVQEQKFAEEYQQQKEYKPEAVEVQQQQVARVDELPSQQKEEVVQQQQHKEEPLKETKLPVREEAKGQAQQKTVQFKEEKFEQRENFEQQQIELKEEQRRFEEPPALVQPIQPLTVVEETRVVQQAATKGGSQFQAPVAEAEPYAFSYQVDGSSRSESGDSKGVVRGQYTLQGPDGSSRIVDYIADQNGFRASVNTNEFGTEAKSPAAVQLRSTQPLAEDITLKLEGKTREDLLPPAAPIAVAVKSFAPAAAPVPVATKTQAFVWESPAKGQKLIGQQQEEVKQVEQQEAPVKSAELRSPKSISQDLTRQVAQPRASFESATAHRVYRAPPQPTYQYQYLRPQHQAPSGVYLRTQPAVVARPAPVSAHRPRPVPRERYPPSVAVRRYPLVVEQPAANPRVSFYGPASGSSFEDETPSEF